MAWWWEGSNDEKFWCEITDRKDIGCDLKCPQTDDAGRSYWSYSLIQKVWPGDIVFHYSTRTKSFVGGSVAGGPIEEREIIWAPHGTVGRAKSPKSISPKPGWWLPLYGYLISPRPLTLKELQSEADEAWIYDWIGRKEETWGSVAAPFQRYGGTLRANQGYLTKMPADFVRRWPELASLAEGLSRTEDELTPLSSQFPPKGRTQSVFKPKASESYVAVIQSAVQRKSRNHEALVKNVAERLITSGQSVSNPHPIDLLIDSSPPIICEFKIARGNPGASIREAVGQLLEYRFFIGPRDGLLCVVLDAAPALELIRYVETALDMLMLWAVDGRIHAGPISIAKIGELGISIQIAAMTHAADAS